MSNLNITQLLSDPKVLEVLKKNYAEDEVNSLLKQELSNAAIKKQIIEGIGDLDEEHLLYLLLRSTAMLLVGLSEDFSMYADICEELADKTNSNLSLLEDTDIKNVIKAIVKSDFFLVKKKGKKQATLDEGKSVEIECPLD